VFRLYNNGQGGQPNHRYTTSWPIISLMQSQGWWIEGVGMCTPLYSAGSTPRDRAVARDSARKGEIADNGGAVARLTPP